MLPSLLTLCNAGVGLLAISKAIDALAGDPLLFDQRLESACWLIFLAMVFDALDGKVARITDSFSDFGAQLDSFADALTFGVAPALIAKVLMEHEGLLPPRLHFFAAASFSLMAILRLARFNLDNDHSAEAHDEFRGLPSPAAAGTIVASILMFLSLRGGIEVADGAATPVGKGLAFLPQAFRESCAGVLLPSIMIMLPLLGLLMVGRTRYVHLGSRLLSGGGAFKSLVTFVFVAQLLYLAPVPMLFMTGLVYVGWGLVKRWWPAVRGKAEEVGKPHGNGE
ncbi:MAG: CDP-diacylglycerol--serine O-phosphatidyltransferase [Chlamydiales bacterium]|jgi:CDP-diacylglycerol--serine O-phosphatidyltransferase